jgi:hypothetical protein
MSLCCSGFLGSMRACLSLHHQRFLLEDVEVLFTFCKVFFGLLKCETKKQVWPQNKNVRTLG